jgi:hypothetical protein
MRQDAEEASGLSFARVARGVGKVILICIVVIAAAGAAGSFSFNVCPGCNNNLNTQTVPEPEEMEKPPASLGKPDVSDKVPLP